MKKICLPLVLIFAVFFAMVSCKKDYSNIVQLSNADSAKVNTVQNGKVIYVALELSSSPYAEPGVWEMDKTILSLNSEGHKGPAAGIIGSAGTYIFTFNTLKPGTTQITLKNTGFGGSYNSLFTTTIKVE